MKVLIIFVTLAVYAHGWPLAGAFDDILKTIQDRIETLRNTQNNAAPQSAPQPPQFPQNAFQPPQAPSGPFQPPQNFPAQPFQNGPSPPNVNMFPTPPPIARAPQRPVNQVPPILGTDENGHPIYEVRIPPGVVFPPGWKLPPNFKVSE